VTGRKPVRCTRCGTRVPVGARGPVPRLCPRCRRHGEYVRRTERQREREAEAFPVARLEVFPVEELAALAVTDEELDAARRVVDP
jgi:hypothetical protein